MSDPLRDKIQLQADKIARDCDRASIRDSLISARWYRWNLLLGMGSAILAGIIASIAGANFKGIQVPESWEPYIHLTVMILASSSAILTSVMTFLAPAEKASIYHEYSNRYWALRDRIRKFAIIDCLSPGKDDLLTLEYVKLLETRIELDRKHPLVPEWVYNVASKKLKEKSDRNRIEELPPSHEAAELTAKAATNISRMPVREDEATERRAP